MLPMKKKIDTLRALINEGNFSKALALAAKFPRLGEHRDAIVLGHEARVHRSIYKQLGRDPDKLVAEGIKALIARYQDREVS